ncbi:hypothetical protein A6P54_13400 [Bacillus sp. MKU004]|nr:hypothetical protein A6P54_13400 [Bacillus sp. MKU004]
MRIAFFCSTPYQLLLATNIKIQLYKNDDADIYVLNHFKNSSELVEKLKDSKLFKNVQHIDCIEFTNSFSENKGLRFIQKTVCYLKYKKITKKYFELEDKFYDKVYFTYPDVIIQLAITELFNKNSDMKIHLYEDGTGGYNTKILETSSYKKLFNKMFGFNRVIDRYDSISIFMPEFYSSNIVIPLERLPKIDINNKELIRVINTIFDYQYDQVINEKIIFLEQPMDFINGLNEEIKHIVEDILKENYIIKLHPRSNTELYANFNVYKKNSIPWEIICLNNEIDDKVIISYFSTGGITNKILFDKEPVVIFLFDLIELTPFHTVPDSTRNFIYRIRDTYRDQSRVIIPKDINELREKLNAIN